MSNDTSTIIQALRTLTNEIESGDWLLNGVMIDAADRLAQLEASHAELLVTAKAVVERWDSPLWKEQEHTGTFINRLRDAIAKAEGEMKQ